MLAKPQAIKFFYYMFILFKMYHFSNNIMRPIFFNFRKLFTHTNKISNKYLVLECKNYEIFGFTNPKFVKLTFLF